MDSGVTIVRTITPELDSTSSEEQCKIVEELCFAQDARPADDLGRCSKTDSRPIYFYPQKYMSLTPFVILLSLEAPLETAGRTTQPL